MKYIIFYLLLMLNTLSYSFHIMPDIFEKRIDAGRGYSEFYFPNNGTETIRYKFSVEPGSSVRGDMSKWVDLYPKVLTVKSGDVGVLKVYAKSPAGTPIGEYGFHLNCVPVNIPNLEKGVTGVKANTGVNISASLELIGYVGDIPPKINLAKRELFTEDGKTKMRVTFKNESLKRGVEYGVEIKGRNKTVFRNSMGRIYENQTVTKVLNLEGMKIKDPYELTIYEEVTNLPIHKIKL
ncbi:MAG: hypothetical protein ACRC7S_08215 [Cetobacterium sp.]